MRVSILGVLIAGACAIEPAPVTDTAAGDGEPDLTATGQGESTTEGAEPPGSTSAPSEPSTTSSSGVGEPADDTDRDDLLLDVGTMPDAPPSRRECETAIDIVFVLDVSTSMDSLLTLLAAEIDAVDAALAKLGLEAQPHYGLAVFVDDAGLMNEGQPFDDIPALQQEFTDWAEWTALGTQLAPSGFLNYTWPENSLDALALAATGFQWRDAETTLRLVIHATDDTFWDGPATENGVDIVNGYEGTVTALQAAQARVFSFTADIGGQCECEDVAAGWSAPYGGQASIPDATDGGRFDIELIVGGSVSFTDAVAAAVDQSYCTEYEPAG